MARWPCQYTLPLPEVLLPEDSLSAIDFYVGYGFLLSNHISDSD